MATVLITGTNRGLGLEFVKHFLGRSDTVIATCRDSSSATELQALAANNENLSLKNLDVSDEQSMAAFATELKDTPIDMFINNAGVYGPRDANFGNVGSSEWEQVIRVNAIAPMLLTQLIIGSLRQGTEKKLVYVTSKMGSIDDNKGGGSYIYRSSKTALNSVVKSLSVDLACEGFSVAVVHPGWVRTDMGGPNGLIDVQTSVSGMLAVIDGLSPDNAGDFFNYDGSLIPW
ncbi:MAG: SDR family oxidoreductase [OM182 bacterium]|uniref:SDR family oxidoreductase n=1 Tax=OM182 bacterium TaxID=2510334 RepID=A0A520RZP8_9GAMM|nr:short-chain dehydrogenase [Gammaproteobacteria bacterium]RZO75710.1 MAG: SDR family oxidoreductase [OM182 bacterium]HBJ88855.1 short-chain dehydrogenase [Gammaproteobacteria bacterium]HCA35064.1 short-chain dehydrogenase [Gammaproteobacteria bacterium]HCL72611.1 short-chain dehydrogenase [Gammaproteobacteria bacterium]|tara:strand:- start:2394 stop:3086 length:693 start_codon:yes stop_codon:yes gene_type:complete